ncbi:MAG: hypothetical protein HDS77_01390 [Bacteroidales bacterium]|nr:hypothetical protein [Bacteroidales bacterium]MBD5258303.1 hypothetical protein [Barnesiella sp.]
MSKLTLTDNEKIFWADLVIYVEQEVKTKQKRFNINNKKLKSFLKQKNINLKRAKISSKPFDKKQNENTITFSKGKNFIADLLCHLRNAFAHSNIEIDNNGDYLLSDYYGTGKLNMKGRISPQLLFELIDQIKAIGTNVVSTSTN